MRTYSVRSVQDRPRHCRETAAILGATRSGERFISAPHLPLHFAPFGAPVQCLLLLLLNSWSCRRYSFILQLSLPPPPPSPPRGALLLLQRRRSVSSLAFARSKSSSSCLLLSSTPFPPDSCATSRHSEFFSPALLRYPTTHLLVPDVAILKNNNSVSRGRRKYRWSIIIFSERYVLCGLWQFKAWRAIAILDHPRSLVLQMGFLLSVNSVESTCSESFLTEIYRCIFLEHISN